eukprot:m.326846 g.326846  ORF g.326846 m.326846 type:complete len:91 (+) comp16487_c1_seq1:84-356(+)
MVIDQRLAIVASQSSPRLPVCPLARVTPTPRNCNVESSITVAYPSVIQISNLPGTLSKVQSTNELIVVASQSSPPSSLGRLLECRQTSGY